MNKRGRAFGIFNGVYGVLWFVGSAVMGALYGVSPVALIAFGLVAQGVAAGVFVWMGRKRMLDA
jgi:hypothetical protein